MALAETGSPFDDIRRLLTSLPGPEEGAWRAVRDRNRNLFQPPGALGRLEEIVEWLAAWQASSPPTAERPRVAIFATSHGVAERGVSANAPSFSKEMVEAATHNRAAVNQVCATFDVGLKVFDLAVDIPTPDISTVAAMDEKTCAATMGFGMEATAGEVDLLCLGDIGVGNTTVAAAIFHALWGGRAEDWVDAGTLGPDGRARKAEIVTQAIAYHRRHLDDPLEVLRRVGGRDIAAIAGAILAARIQRIPVLLDGFVVTAAAAILHALEPRALDHCRAAHCSGEPAHRAVLARLQLDPLLDLGLKLGQGTGAAMAVALAKAAVACHNGTERNAG